MWMTSQWYDDVIIMWLLPRGSSMAKYQSCDISRNMHGGVFEIKINNCVKLTNI